MESTQLSIREENTEYGRSRFVMTIPIVWHPEPKHKFSLFNPFRKKQDINPVELEATRDFVFDPIVVGKISSIVKKINDLPNELYGNTPAELSIDIVEKHNDALVYIVAESSIQGSGEPSPELIKFVSMNFTFDMLLQGLQIVMRQLQLPAFLNCLMLLKGTSSIINPGSELMEQPSPDTKQVSSIIKTQKSHVED